MQAGAPKDLHEGCSGQDRSSAPTGRIIHLLISRAAISSVLTHIYQIYPTILDPAPPCWQLLWAVRTLLLPEPSFMDRMELVVSEGLPASLWGVNGIVKGHTPLVILCQKQHKHSACKLPKLLCFPPAPPVSQERWINTESNDSKLRICTHCDTGLSFTIYSLSFLLWMQGLLCMWISWGLFIKMMLITTCAIGKGRMDVS